jgi:GNAT superfamily N-acetyltransferase
MNFSSPYPKKLSPASRDALIRHFCALGGDDRRLRFGSMIADAGLAAYVAQIDFERDAVFGIFDEELTLAGVAHVAIATETAELGVSVLPACRGRGVGSALFDRAGMFARNALVRVLFMHCLTENAAMMHIARKAKMRIVAGGGEADAHLELAPGDPSSITREMMQEQIALFDFALRSHVLSARRIGEAVMSPADSKGAQQEAEGLRD